jgi:putative hydroxymethylpyrimidine transport system permease protein
VSTAVPPPGASQAVAATPRRPRGSSAAAALLALCLLGIWEAYAQLGPVDPYLLPAPTDVARALWEDRSLLADNLVVTAREVVLGLLLALLAAAALATALHFWTPVRRAVYPLLVASQAVPIVVIAPVLVAWLGFGLAPKLVVVALVCFFPVVVGAMDGLAGVDPDLGRLARTLGASRRRLFLRIEAPAALPSLLSGAKVAVAVAVIGAVLAEQAGSSEGLGHVVTQAIPQFETARAYAAVVLLAALAVALFAALSEAERRWIPWARPSKGGSSHGLT